MEILSLQDYSIYVGNFWPELRSFLSKGKFHKHIILVDENTEAFCLPLLMNQLPDINFELIRISSGEQHKNINTCKNIWTSLFQLEASRNALLINLGGGVIGDMGGFCASTYKRGIPFIQIPSTLLSQVDASIGGKLGIDFLQVKNGIGVFNNPHGVFIDPGFYQTLPKEELRSGFAEVIKHSLIADQKQWDYIKQQDDLTLINWETLLVPSLKIKKHFVESDPFEKGLRKALNFGHTIGHAIEGFGLETNQPLLHGEAIAIGMICETFLSYLQFQLEQEHVAQISKYILKIFGHHPLDLQYFGDYLELMKNDKKNTDGAINFSLLKGPGQVQVNQTCPPGWILQSLQYYNDLAAVVI